MQPLISIKSKTENVVWIRTQMIEAFCFNEKENKTFVWTIGGSENEYIFPGNHVDEIIAAIHGWDQ